MPHQRASYAAYQAMWAALEDPPSGGRWRHLRVISDFMRGYWFAPMHPPTWPGLLEHLRLPLNRLYQFRVDADYDLILLDSVSAEECIATTARTIAEVDQTSASTPAPHEITLPG